MGKSIGPDKFSKLDKKIQLIKHGKVIGNYCFWAGIGIQFLVMILGHSVWEMPFRGRFLQLAFLLFCTKILLTEYSIREWGSMILLGGVGCISYLATGEEYVLSIIVMIFAEK